ncbi:hypothetical protein ACFQ6U_13515 [Streptomyces sp. NPDC056465]|uniref:hypothetical protein n=1 Tax=unclassified Streptomyces TaxID=2593676 RepID=UPI0035DB452E
MSDSFAATYAPLVEQIRAARQQGDKHAEELALEVLLQGYVRLGHRELGTVEEQNQYIVSRHMCIMPKTLQELGVTPADLPPPPTGRRPTPPPPATEANTAHLAELFAHIGSDDIPEDRFTVAYRPEDGMVYKGKPAPFAVVDGHDGLPVGWYTDRDWAETTAGTASRLRSA